MPDIITSNQHANPDRSFLIGNAGVLTKGEAVVRGDRVARALVEQGLYEGDFVFIRLPPSSFERAISEVACMIGGFPYIAEDVMGSGYLNVLMDGFSGKYEINDVTFPALETFMTATTEMPWTPDPDGILCYGRSSGTSGHGFLPTGEHFPHKFVKRTRAKTIQKNQWQIDTLGYSVDDIILLINCGTLSFTADQIAAILSDVNGTPIAHDTQLNVFASDQSTSVRALIETYHPTKVFHWMSKRVDGAPISINNFNELVAAADLSSVHGYWVNGPVTDAEMQAAHDRTPAANFLRGSSQKENMYPFSCLLSDPVDKRLATQGSWHLANQTVHVRGDTGELLISKDATFEYVGEPVDRYVDGLVFGDGITGLWSRSGDVYAVDGDGFMTYQRRLV